MARRAAAASGLALATALVLPALAVPVLAPATSATDPATLSASAAPVPPDPASVAAGAAVFIATGCGNCHAVRGTAARGTAGPDLTHLASRHTLAGAMLPNTRGNLAGWITNPQSLKPGALMPALPIAPTDLQRLLDYLQSLR